MDGVSADVGASSSCLAAAVLCQAVKGLLWDGEEERIYNAEECADWLKKRTL